MIQITVRWEEEEQDYVIRVMGNELRLKKGEFAELLDSMQDAVRQAERRS